MGNTLVAAAYRESSNAVGINGNSADNSLANAGAVYTFGRSGLNWGMGAYVKSTNTNLGDDFGYGAVISADASMIAIAAEGEASGNGDPSDNSAPGTGALYTFTTSPFAPHSYLKAPNGQAGDEMGYGLATSTSGDAICVGAPFEASAATGVDGNGADNSAIDAGAVYLFSTGALAPHYIKAPETSPGDQFGWACALSAFGDVLAVSALNENGSGVGIDPPPDENAPNAGAVWVYY